MPAGRLPELHPIGCREIENQMRPTGRAAVFAGDDRLMLRGDLLPLRDAVGVVLRGVDVDAAHAGCEAHRQADQVLGDAATMRGSAPRRWSPS